MAKCICCKKPIVSGYVVCADCAKEVKPGEVSEGTMRFIDRLAETLADSNTIVPCTMCSNVCHGERNAHNCSAGIRLWLMERAKEA